jgi:hypothetical protein
VIEAYGRSLRSRRFRVSAPIDDGLWVLADPRWFKALLRDGIAGVLTMPPVGRGALCPEA